MPDNLTGTETFDTDSISPAARVGAGLREVRERLGWKLPEVAESLRIRAEFLSAMERGDLSSLPGPAYRAGFVRSYAQALGLDGEEILRRFREAGQMGEAPKTEIQFLAPVPDRGVPKGAIVLIGIVVVLAGYGLWYHHTEQERRLAQAVPQVPAELAPAGHPSESGSAPCPSPKPRAAGPGQTQPGPSATQPAASRDTTRPKPTHRWQRRPGRRARAIRLDLAAAGQWHQRSRRACCRHTRRPGRSRCGHGDQRHAGCLGPGYGFQRQYIVQQSAPPRR